MHQGMVQEVAGEATGDTEVSGREGPWKCEGLGRPFQRNWPLLLPDQHGEYDSPVHNQDDPSQRSGVEVGPRSLSLEGSSSPD